MCVYNMCVYYKIRIDEDVRQRRNGCRDPMALLSTPSIHCNLLFNWKKFRLSRGQITGIDYRVFSVVFSYILFVFVFELFIYLFFFFTNIVPRTYIIFYIHMIFYLFKRVYHRLTSTVINLFIFVLYRSAVAPSAEKKINGNNLVCLSATTLIHPK